MLASNAGKRWHPDVIQPLHSGTYCRCDSLPKIGLSPCYYAWRRDSRDVPLTEGRPLDSKCLLADGGVTLVSAIADDRLCMA